jgi:hypothetical protein
VPANPFLKTIVLTTLNTNYSLLTLIQAIDPGAPPRACHCQIQLDNGAGAAHLFVGNDDISGTNFGVNLVAGQQTTFDSTPQNLINISNIFLRSDTSAVKVNVKILVQ